MSSEHKLGKDVFVALAAVGWADGNLDRDEADAILRAAAEEGLEIEELGEIEEATKTPCEIGVIDRLHMSKADRLYVYAIASWITRMDGFITTEEEASLMKLGQALGVPEAPRRHADEIVAEISALPEGDRPHRYDLHALRKTIEVQLKAAQEARAKMKEEAHDGHGSKPENG